MISGGNLERLEAAEQAPLQKCSDGQFHRHVGRRRGRRLRPMQQRRLDDMLPELLIECQLDGSRIVDPRSDIFQPARPVWMEIGFGSGEHLAAQASRHPEVGFIGVEPYINGVASFLGHAERQALRNVRLFTDDVLNLLPSLRESSIERLYVLFPDPWPKRRHRQRRILIGKSLDLLIKLLAQGGRLDFASDHKDYAAVVKRSIEAYPNMRLFVDSEIADGCLPDDWVKTRYYQKAERAGRRVFHFQFGRVQEAP